VAQDPRTSRYVTAMPRSPLRLAICLSTVLVLLVGAGVAAAAGPSAEIRRTSYGIPHIKASTYEGIGYGYGYAFAQDNLCVIADTYVTVNAQRSRFFGPEGKYLNRGNGSEANNLNSDFFYQRIIDSKVIDGLLAQNAPVGPLPELRETVKGYVEGYNELLQSIGGTNGVKDPACKGKEWVRPITTDDVWRRFYQLALLASGGVAIDGIGAAQPPTPASPAPLGAPRVDLLPELKARMSHVDLGSNAVGLGKEATDNGRGMVLGNPHFPWDGPERFYQAQLTIPGKLDVTGASLYGVPAVLIGHTKNLAWSHTVSTAFRFAPVELKLVPGSPTTYLVDGKAHEMKRETVKVMARTDAGTLEPRTRTLYSSLHGPIFNAILGLPLFPWSTNNAYAMADSNATNFRLLNHFADKDRAQSVEELDAIERRYQGIPWVNTIAADSSGKAYYADIGTVPNVDNDKAARCVNGPLGIAVSQALPGLPVLDGSQSSCELGADPAAVVPGILPASKMPSMVRDDFVTNGNDSFWLTNPKQPLEGFPDIMGSERTTRSLRTRLGLRIVMDRLAGKDGQPGNRFSLQGLQDAAFNNRNYSGELFRDELVAYCKANPTINGVDVSEACPVLERWDLHDDLDSKGAFLFRRFATRVLTKPAPAGPSPSIYDVEFDANDPVNTPRGLNTNNPLVGQALADAVTDLRSSKVPLDAPLRGYQYEKRGEEPIPVHGGPGPNGVFNVITAPFVPGQGFPNVVHGSSFVMAAQFTDGCPESRSILTYSLSSDPTSPFFSDQNRLYAKKQWVDMRFCESEILADPNLQITRLGAGAGAAKGAKACASRRTLRSKLRTRRGERVRSVRVTVDGRRVRGKAIRRRGRAVRVALTGLRKGTHRVRIIARTTRGRTVIVKRTVRTCVARKKH
jgi:acyl-homoserine-lactone acylase